MHCLVHKQSPVHRALVGKFGVNIISMGIFEVLESFWTIYEKKLRDEKRNTWELSGVGNVRGWKCPGWELTRLGIDWGGN